MLKSIAKLIGGSSEQSLKKLRPIVESINGLEPENHELSDEGLRSRTVQLRARVQAGEDLDDLLPEAFAAVREAAQRTLGQRHFDVQLMGGIVLHQGKIAEMKTGEGKTLVATLSAYLNATLLFVALRRQGVYRSETSWRPFLLRIVLATMAMALILWWGAGSIVMWSAWTALFRAATLASWIGFGATTYFVVLWLLGVRFSDMALREPSV